MRIDAYASEVQYFEHLLPVWRGLPDEWRGELLHHPRIVGLPGIAGYPRPRSLTIVASLQDHRSVRAKHGRSVFLEHGAGQTYVDVGSGSYAGGPGRHDVALFICPSTRVALLNRRAYPTTPAVVVGCPKLDTYQRAPDREPLAVVSFHADLRANPETSWAFTHYESALWAWAAEPDDGLRLAVHCHPRMRRIVEPWAAARDVEYVADFADVARRAAVYAVDNSSTAYEAAALGIPVLSLNAPWFRRDVSHGLRFWDTIPGLQIDDGWELRGGLERALADPPEARDLRLAAVAAAYDGLVDGEATARAVAAIGELVDGEHAAV